ncbi:glycoside hydrolase family 78 protein [Flavilitoribacter nigricans]|uniref:alpha-L-rhamnosidase n=1 Tax=Flavilitoribacter nigricans (strain ATCC 23147 / DSM 23189 / NBRC 102662 / NCIMB 1420 / SS-2) TaxID=1122177 RepID=A0A2D0NIE6_FLAN2|nr:glycoside hydrolase family 78 protein [Flavilitoribacter nigricans]PHN08275.1 alpha-L-rhamnosidase [Flavilitoribacter nigricans DSM 23189 = NBRC 102662]
MRYLSLVALIGLCFFTLPLQALSVYDLSCEHKVNPMGIEAAKPRLSWKLEDRANGIMQTAYAIRVATDMRFNRKSLVWNSGKTNSGQSVLVPYAGAALESGQRYYWQVKIWDNQGQESDWSEAAFWETGLLNTSDWQAEWIEPKQDTLQDGPAYLLRKDFSLNRNIASARAYVSARGLYELFLNGRKVGDEVFTPGWTVYHDRIQYQVFDVTDLVQRGENAVGIHLGDGWFRGALGWMDNWAIYGKAVGAICQIEVTYTNGQQATIVTDGSWKSSQEGPIVLNSIYNGETYDARKEMNGWNEAGFNMKDWDDVTVADHSKEVLIATETVSVRKIEEIQPVKVWKTPKGTLVADLGQNLVGWIKLKVEGPAGTTVTIRHAEVLDKYGEFYTENLRAAKAALTYTLKGDGLEVYEPSFTFMGFRYIAIDGFPGELSPENITAVVIHSDMEPTGTFECSNPLINQLQHNIVWGQKGNFLDVPTDCPQRDERLGWTGDAQAFCRTAAFNMDVSAFFTKWLKDLSADQLDNGGVPFVIPNALRQGGVSAGWGDVATIAPWTMYLVYGDKDLLATQYPSMKAYVDYIREKSGDSYLWTGGSVFGDWLYYKPKMTSHTEPDGYTNPDMIATMFYAYSSRLLSQAAEVLGKDADAKFYAELYQKIKSVFQDNYVTGSGRIASDSQTSYVLALMFDLLSDELRPKAAEHLVNNIRKRNNHLSTGFLGTPYLCHVLSDNGYTDVGYDLLLQEEYPSWLYPVKMGATTIWERWDGQKTDSTFQDKGMNSFNHYAYGAIGDWMYRVVAGIEIGAPGYKQIRIQPHPDERLEFARATFDSSYGEIASGWTLKDGQLQVNVTIPPNTAAIIELPKATITGVQANGQGVRENADLKNVEEMDDKLLLEVGSGQYSFSYSYE